MEFLDDAPENQPFCLSLSFSAPHAHDGAPLQYFWTEESDHLYQDIYIPGPILAGPRYAFSTLYYTREFQEWKETESKILLHGPMLGDVTHEGALFWVRTAQEANIEIQVRPARGMRSDIRSSGAQTSTDSDYTAVVRVEGYIPFLDLLYFLWLSV